MSGQIWQRPIVEALGRNHDYARMVKVIETTLVQRGSGKDEGSPIRMVTQYWSLEGNLLAEVDPAIVVWENAAGSRLFCQPHLDPNIAANFGPMRWRRQS